VEALDPDIQFEKK